MVIDHIIDTILHIIGVIYLVLIALDAWINRHNPSKFVLRRYIMFLIIGVACIFIIISYKASVYPREPKDSREYREFLSRKAEEIIKSIIISNAQNNEIIHNANIERP